ncbi:phosphoglycerate mutase family protein [Rhizobiaceae bacterium BDR2-2]|uniref:Phosphoglycerate mutase family protein n=1 Tax=Ectorhizobium quercum TaxID=2965071 RepID=A0AAE3MYF9_9HYPH|nr:histidine phosphatase family protein [Ectorhizobium quercum]MCX8996374.1 phosphoglycerate mutase family protein [Ectorhizobium quercum]MCX8998587.1 phosphoglycerate mutase family protein [Ectorhizobium quercum]
MLIYVIRHGQTDWNAEQRMQGQRDIPLNSLGRAQATGNGEALKAVLGASAAAYDYVASPLGRTRETMERMRSAMGLDPRNYTTDARLVEVSFGDWEGFTLAELAQRFPERVAERERSKWDFIPPGPAAESYEILSWRVGSWLASVNRPTVCVCHGGVIRSLFRLVGGLEPDQAAVAETPQDRILSVAPREGRIGWV